MLHSRGLQMLNEDEDEASESNLDDFASNDSDEGITDIVTTHYLL